MRKRERALLIWECAIVLALTTGCAATTFESSGPGPGVPRISNLRIEPTQAENGAQVLCASIFEKWTATSLTFISG